MRRALLLVIGLASVLSAFAIAPASASAARIVAGPPAYSPSPDATFTWERGGGVVLVTECRIDGTRVDCSPPTTTLRGLPDGEHRFQIREIGLLTDDTVEWRWTIDTRPPDTVFTAKPRAVGDERSARFAIEADEDGVRFECRLDGATFAPCDREVILSVGDGLHTFEARAIDRAGNVDASPARYSWFVLPLPLPPPPSNDGAGSSGPIGGGLGPVLGGSPPRAELRILGSRTARQGRPVRFDASRSRAGSAPIVLYRFDWGDGTSDTTYQSRALHAYRRTGTFAAKVTAIDRDGRASTSQRVRVVIIDGEPPVISVRQPRPGGRVRMGRSGVRISGYARDRSGVRTVWAAMHLAATTGFRQRAGAPLCAWYDGRSAFRVRSCARPLWFRTRLQRGGWSFVIPRRARIFAGTWVLRIRAADKVGNVADDLSLRRRTLVPFELLPYRGR